MMEMKKNFRKITSLVIALAVMVTAVVFDVPETVAVEAAVSASVPGGCNGDHTGMTAWTDATKLPTNGSYYLDTDVNVSNGISANNSAAFLDGGGVNLTLCLNGHTINAQKKARIFYIGNDASLTLCDCKGTGKLTGGGNVTAGGAVSLQSGSFTMYGGIISGNEASNGGGGVYLGSTMGTFTMYGGTISGNTASGYAGGGGVLASGGPFTIDGKVEITGNTLSGSDNNVQLNRGKTITIGNNFDTDSKIGVNVKHVCGNTVNVTAFADGVTPRDISGKFSADLGGQSIVNSTDNIVQLAMAHALTKTAKKDATCTEAGNIEYWTCSTCNKYFSDEDCTTEITNTVIAATGHSYKATWSSDGANHWHECTKCGDKKDTAAHSGGTATCQTQATCSVCGQKYGSVGAHNYGTTWTTDADQHWHACQTAGCIEKNGAASHTFVQKKDGTNHWQECSVCGYKKDETAHTWGSWEMTTDPTLKTMGEAERTCDCGEKDTKSDVPALTDTTVWTKTSHKDATEEAEGEDVYESTDYGTVTVVLSALGHAHDWSDEWSKDDTYHWHDCLKNCGEKNDNAAHIWDNGTVTKQPTAAAEGEKTFECTVCGKTKMETLPPKGEPGGPNSGNISVDVQPGENVPATKLEKPFDELVDAVLTSEEQENIKNGIDIKIILIVSDATQSVPTDDKAKIEAALRELSDYKIGQYLDLNLLKIIGSSEGIKITQMNKPLTVTFEVPASLRGKAEYSVIRVHGGETEALSDLDSDPNTVTIETDKFSTYTLVYKDVKTEPEQPGDSSSDDDDREEPTQIVQPVVQPTQPAQPSAQPQQPTQTDKSDEMESAETGDRTPIALYGGLVVLSMLALGAVLLERKKRFNR